MADFAGGSGTEEDPYLIETSAHLKNIHETENLYFKQIADIDLSNEEDWSSLDVYGIKYNGNGHTIKNLTMPGGHGFFYELSTQTGNIIFKDLILKDFVMEGEGHWSGCLAGYFSIHDNNALIENITIENFNHEVPEEWMQSDENGSVSNGLLFGEIQPQGEGKTEIKGCTMTGSVFGKEYTGALCGSIEFYSGAEVYIEECWADVELKGIIGRAIGYNGGFISYASDNWENAYLEINNCGVVGSVTPRLNENGEPLADLEENIYLMAGFGVFDFGNTQGNHLVLKNCYAAVDFTNYPTFYMYNTDRSENGIFAFIVNEDELDWWLSYDESVYDISNCYGNGDLDGDSDGYSKTRTTEEMTDPYNEDTTYIDWDFEKVWRIYSDRNDGYPVVDPPSFGIKWISLTREGVGNILEWEVVEEDIEE